MGQSVQVMPCNAAHAFHPPCLKPWLAQHNSCPICRHELPTTDERARPHLHLVQIYVIQLALCCLVTLVTGSRAEDFDLIMPTDCTFFARFAVQ